MNRKRSTKATGHPVMDGLASIRRTRASGAYWQFYMWIPGERATFRKSLKTTDYESAIEAARKLCIELHLKVLSGQKLFGMSLSELVDSFLDYKLKEVGNDIVAERHSTIKTYLKPLQRWKGAKTLVGELDRKAVYNYAKWRRQDKPTIKDVTIRNEQATINMMMKFAYREGLIRFETFDFAKLHIKEVGRRDTFTHDEYKKLYEHMRVWVNAERRIESVRAERLMVRDCILFAANCMLRVGKYRQLRWKDVVKFEDLRDDSGRPVCLVTIKVRSETSKTRTSRTVTTRGGEFLKRLRDRTPSWQPDDFIFCGSSGSTQFSERKSNQAWADLMAGVGIDYKARNITWYSLRHYAITCRLEAGVPAFLVADIAGTGIEYIQKHYGHVDQRMARDAALRTLSR